MQQTADAARKGVGGKCSGPLVNVPFYLTPRTHDEVCKLTVHRRSISDISLMPWGY